MTTGTRGMLPSNACNACDSNACDSNVGEVMLVTETLVTAR